jgi:HD-like signal output (HDOD) protein/CheY-like chemotaxis protein
VSDKPHIVFVDDEPRILGGLRRLLRSQRERWEMSFTGSGHEALDLLQSSPCDVIVSDYRMPGMDGAELLQLVRERHPGTARVILSGQTNEASVIKIMILAHRFLNKPSTEEEIVETVEQLVGLRQTAAGDTMRLDVAAIESLPSPPNTLGELIAALDPEDASARSVADVIARDPATTAKVLHLVNSSAYAPGRQIGDIGQAVAMLGLQTVRGLVLMHDLVRAFDMPPGLPDGWLEGLTRHSVETSRLARQFAGGQAWEDEAFSAGLLHEVGQLVLASSRTTTLATALAAWKNEDVVLDAAETETLGVAHTVIGAHLLGLWGLPEQVIAATAQHAARELPTVVTDVVSAVALAHAIVETDFEPVCGRMGAPPVDEEALDPALQESIARWRQSRPREQAA